MKNLFKIFLLAYCFLLTFHGVALAARSEIGTPRLMQGPMLGYVTQDTITLWARLNGPFTFQAVFSESPDMNNARKTETVEASKENDYSVQVQLQGLQPDRVYYYRALVNGNPDPNVNTNPPLQCKTAPAGPAKFTVGFGSCARVQRDREQPIWNVVQRWRPDLFFWTGDNIYGDSRDPDILAEEYRRQREVLSLQPVLHSVPQLAVWDDHDFALNDHDRENPVKDEALRVFKQYWANPSYGLESVPGVFFQYSYGGVDFFFLDVRYHRSPNDAPDGSDKTMLGEGQLQWLKEGLQKSEAPFKVLISGSAWSNAKGPGGDSWSAFLHERDALFDFIRDENVSGVILLSGDTHVGELNAIPWSEKGGYDFYDLVSSPLAQSSGTGWVMQRPERRIRQVFNMSSNVGLMEFDLTGEPTLRFNLYDIYGNPVWSRFEIRADELRNGVSSWQKMMDATSRSRHESEKGYYER